MSSLGHYVTRVRKDHLHITGMEGDLGRENMSLRHTFPFSTALAHKTRQIGKQKRAHVITHDHEGLMSLRANLLHGCDFASLCLINVVALGPFGQPLFKLIADSEEIFNALTGPVFEGVVESYIRDAAYTELDKETMEALKRPWIMSEVGRRGFIRQMVQANSRSTEEVEGRYPEVGNKMPVKVIWGREDKWIPVETAERLKEKLSAWMSC